MKPTNLLLVFNAIAALLLLWTFWVSAPLIDGTGAGTPKDETGTGTVILDGPPTLTTPAKK